MESEREFLEQFINIYHGYPCLWDTKCKEYMNKQLRNDAYDELAKKSVERYPNANREFVIKKIHSLRCCFRRELKKVQESHRTGTSTDDIYIPNLWYYDLISFIADSEIPRKGISNLETQDSANRDQEEDISDEDEEIIDDDSQPVVSPQSRASSSQSVPSASGPVSTPSSRKRKFNKTELFGLASETLKKFNRTPQNKDDEYSVAGRKYACDLKMLTTEQRIIAEKLVSDVIFHAKLNKLTLQSSLHVQPQQHTPHHNSQYRQQQYFDSFMHTRSDQFYEPNSRQPRSESSGNDFANYLVFNK